MKKVGIVTLYRNNKNFGGLLQAYALIKTVEKCGCKAEIFDYVQNGLPYKLNRFQNLGFHRTMQYFKNKLITELNYRKHPDVHRGVLLRNKRLHDFEVSLPHSAPVGDAEVSKLAARYDCLIAGSDQIWNPGLWNPVMFLDIEGFKGCRFSYAASMGRDRLTVREAGFLKKHIKSLDAVSVREESAGRIISSVTGKSVLTVCDPTCLLNTDECRSLRSDLTECLTILFFHFSLVKTKMLKVPFIRTLKGSCRSLRYLICRPDIKPRMSSTAI